MHRGIEDASEDAAGRLLGTDPELQRLGETIRREQGRLKRLIPWEAWQAYLRIEEASNERMFKLLDKLRQ